MEFPERGIRHLHHEDERERWSFALRAAVVPLRGLVRGYCLFEERREPVPVHQHLPHPDATFLIGLGGRIEVQTPADPVRVLEPGQGFLAGLHTAPARTRSRCGQRGLQIELTGEGAHRLLGGAPMHPLANRGFGLDELLGGAGRELGQRLVDAAGDGGPEAAAVAFDLLDRFLAGRLLGASRREPSAGVRFAWDALARSHGARPIGAIGRELGWSRKRLVAGFREQIGVAPKTAARLLRFDHAMTRWKARPERRWIDLALEAGYADQAHFAREVRALAGQTPTQLAARLLPGSGGFALD